MTAVALSPKAGAHGELCGMMAIKAAIEAKGEGATRNVVLVPDSAHGTNPATAALIGFKVKPVPAREDGTVHVEDVKELSRPRRRGDHAHQPQHLRPVRAAGGGDRRGGARRRAPTSTATAPTSTPSSARCGRAISASTPCTSTCTRPSRRRMAAAGRAPARWCCPRASRPSRRCRSCAPARTASSWSSSEADAAEQARSAA